MDNVEKPLTMEIEPAVSQFRQRRIALHQYRRQITALLREIVQSLRSLNTAIQTQKIQTSPAANRNDGSPKTGVAVERFDSYCELTKGNIRRDHEIISWLIKRNIILNLNFTPNNVSLILKYTYSHMKQTADGHQYIALGVSNDDRMGDDLTFICKHEIFDDKSVSTFN